MGCGRAWLHPHRVGRLCCASGLVTVLHDLNWVTDPHSTGACAAVWRCRSTHGPPTQVLCAAPLVLTALHVLLKGHQHG